MIDQLFDRRVTNMEDRRVYNEYKEKIEAGKCSVKDLRQAKNRKENPLTKDQFGSLAALLAETLERERDIDDLTNILNHRLLEPVLERAIEKLDSEEESSKPEGKRIEAIIVLFVDIDNMKDLNDKYDHSVGTKAIITVANRLTKATRGKDDKEFHIYGDEFVVVMSITDKNPLNVVSILERIEHEVNDNLSVSHDNINTPFRVTIGYKVRERGDKTTAQELVKEADKTMKNKKDPTKHRKVSVA